MTKVTLLGSAAVGAAVAPVAATPAGIGTEMTPVGRGRRAMIAVSFGRGSGRLRDSAVAVRELPHPPQNIAPTGNQAPHI